MGTAQDGGFPHPACTCARCEAARRRPELRRHVASLAIVVPRTGRRYLVDATPDLEEQLAMLPPQGHARGGVDRAPVDGVLLTHVHIGHVLGLAFFGFEAIHSDKLPVFATERAGAFLGENGPWRRMLLRHEIEIRTIVPGTPIDLGGGVSVTPFAVPHRDEDSDTVGFRIAGPRHAVVYVPDTDRWSTWSPPLTEILRDGDDALLDGTFYSEAELPGRSPSSIGHPLVGATMDLLADRVAAGRLAVAFTHLNHSNPLSDLEDGPVREVRRRGFEVLRERSRFPL